MERLVYQDYRPIRKGDVGWTIEKQRARRMYSPSKQSDIARRQFTEHAEKVSQQQFQKLSGEKPKQQKVKSQPKKPRAEPKKKKGKQKATIREIKGRLEQRKQKKIATGQSLTDYRERALFFEQSYARRISKEYGYELDFDSLSSGEKSDFWKAYHQLMQEGVPSKDRVADYYDDFFDASYEIYEDTNYGDTP